MTQRQKLDKILYGLVSRLPKKWESSSGDKILTFEYLCNILFGGDILAWEVSILKDILIEDGYIEEIDVEGLLIPNITHKGIKFIQDGGYVKEQERKDSQDELVKTSIENNKRSKLALAISIVSLVLSVVTFIIGQIRIR